MPTTRKQELPGTGTTVLVDEQGTPLADEERGSALKALLDPPTTITSDLSTPKRARIRPYPTDIVHDWFPGGQSWMVWSDIYPRMVPSGRKDRDGFIIDNRETARRGDIVVVPDDAATREHIEYGYLIPPVE